MSAPIYLTTIGLFLGTILLVFGIRAVSAVLQARARLAHDGAYRDLAERSDAAIGRVDTALGDMAARLASIEKVLKDVG